MTWKQLWLMGFGLAVYLVFLASLYMVAGAWGAVAGATGAVVVGTAARA